MATYTGTDWNDVFDGSARGERVFGRGGDDELYGYGGDDVLYGEAGDDLLAGGTGDDRLSGGTGSDLLAGEAGADVLDGGDGFDYADYFYSTAGVSVDLSRGRGDDGYGTRDRIANIEGVFGSRFGDRLTGDAGTNELYGDDGNDLLTGGAGQDLTVGGRGADRFAFADGDVSSSLRRADLIGDFSRREGDRIDVRGLDADAVTDGDQAFRFVGRGAFSGTRGELRYEFANGETVLTADVDGDRVADGYVRVSGTVDFVAADFQL